MTALVTARARQLAGTLAELKAKVRAALATELAGAVGAAVRDVLLGGLVDRLVLPPRDARPTLPDRWRDGGYSRERDAWGEPRDPWAEPEDDMPYDPAGYGRDGRAGLLAPDRPTSASPAAAVAVGVTVGRWWLARGGSSPAAAGLVVLATALGLAGGPAAGAALAVLAAAADVLAAESALARFNPF